MHIHVDYKNLAAGFVCGVLVIAMSWAFVAKLDEIEARNNKREVTTELIREQIAANGPCVKTKPKRFTIAEFEHGPSLTYECL